MAEELLRRQISPTYRSHRRAPTSDRSFFAYDASGNVLSETRGLGTPAQAVYATYSYGADGERLSVQDAGGPAHLTTYAYDGFNRLATTTYPDTTTDRITLYDDNSNIKTAVNRAAQSFSYGYDVLNRQTSKVVPAYGAVAANTIATQYDLGGRVTQIADTPGNLIADSYDGAGRVTSVATTIAGLTGAMITQYTLDPNSNRTRLSWPDGYAVDYGYDTLNRMMTATGPSSTTLATYSYDALSRRTNLAYGNTASMAYGYSDGGDLLSLAHDFATNSKNVSYTMTYNPSPSSPSTHQLASEDISKANYEWQPPSSGTAATDAYGSVNTVNQYPTMTPAGNSAQSLSYDTNANLTGDGTWTFGYDPENHMMSATSSGASATYAYDPLGRRQTKTVGSTITNFLSDGDDIFAEYDGPTGNVLRRFVPGPAINEPIAYENCSGATAPNCSGTGVVTEFYHSDHHGSVVTMSGATGDPVATEGPNEYDPFGRANMTATGQPFRYVGMYYDAETGLYQDRARCYIPNLGRFCQTDPVGYKDDLDLYSYVYNDPTDRLDPSGETWADLLTDPAAPRAAAEILGGIGLMLFGGGGDAGSAAAEGATLGAATPITVPAAIASTGLIATGGLMTAQGASTLSTIVNRNAPEGNGGNTDTQHGSADHDAAVNREVRKMRDRDYGDIRKNQAQVDANGNKVGNNRPDVQGTNPKTGQREHVEVDRDPRRGAKHERDIMNKDPNAKCTLLSCRK